MSNNPADSDPQIEPMVSEVPPLPTDDDEEGIDEYVDSLFQAFCSGFHGASCLVDEVIENRSPGVVLLEAITSQVHTLKSALAEWEEELFAVIKERFGGVSGTRIRISDHCPNCGETTSGSPEQDA